MLANYFLKDFCAENEIPLKTFAEQSRQKLMAYHYPGNVRELKSVVNLAATFANAEVIQPDDITFSTFDPLSENMDEEMTLRDFDKKLVATYLKKYNNDTRMVAKKLDIGVSTIYRMMKE